MKRTLLIAVICVCSFAIFQKLTLIKTRLVPVVAQTEESGIPVRLRIPSIQVDARVEEVGVSDAGEMAVPSNAANVGWYMFGSKPGETGSSVIAGHLDTQRGENGVFFDLNRLKPGDILEVENAEGKILTFVVRESRIYDPGKVNGVFDQSDGIHLNLITCEGAWDEGKKSFTKRLVVFADILQ